MSYLKIFLKESLIRGQAQRAVAPIVIVWFFIFGPWGSMAALWREHRKMMKFGTLVVMVINSDLTNFGVSRTNSIAPPPVQKFNIEMVITPEPLILEKWNLVILSFCSLDYADSDDVSFVIFH